MITSQLVDMIVATITVGLGIVVLWRGFVARRFTELWWSCVAVAILAALSVESNAVALDDQLTVSVSGLLMDLAALTAAALAVRCLLAHRGRRAGWQRSHTVVTGLTAAVLIATWMAAATMGLPAGLDESTAADFGTGLAAHVLVLDGYLLVALAVVVWLGLDDLRDLPLGRPRMSMRLLAASAAGGALWAAGGFMTHLAVVLDLPVPPTLPVARDALLAAGLGLFLAGVAVPLPRGRREQLELDVAAQYAGVLSLWSWTTTSPLDPYERAGELDDEAALDLVIEIRDQIHDMQRWVGPAEYSAAVKASRQARLSGSTAKAWVTAVCLELARAAQLRGEPPVRAGLNLSALGGGNTVADEAAWLAEVAYARVDGAAAAAAVIDARLSPERSAQVQQP